MLDVLLDTALDLLKLLPFLFLTYLLLEFIEHKAKEKTEHAMRRAGGWGPFIGSILGVVPQCGFSASASNLYAENIISAGTLCAVFLSTSDEMLPIMISEHINPLTVVEILGIKVIAGIIVGLILDLILRSAKKEKEIDIKSFCEDENCKCEESGIFKSALFHTLKISVFIAVITLALNIIIFFIGEDTISSLMSGIPVLGCVISGIIGLIPNCAASVVITELYLNGVISVGALLSGLLAGSGIGILILFKVNKNIKNNLIILGTVYGSGVLIGSLFDIFKIML